MKENDPFFQNAFYIDLIYTEAAHATKSLFGEAYVLRISIQSLFPYGL
jgi:hypothetical protein